MHCTVYIAVGKFGKLPAWTKGEQRSFKPSLVLSQIGEH